MASKPDQDEKEKPSFTNVFGLWSKKPVHNKVVNGKSVFHYDIVGEPLFDLEGKLIPHSKVIGEPLVDIEGKVISHSQVIGDTLIFNECGKTMSITDAITNNKEEIEWNKKSVQWNCSKMMENREENRILKEEIKKLKTEVDETRILKEEIKKLKIELDEMRQRLSETQFMIKKSEQEIKYTTRPVKPVISVRPIKTI